MANIIIIALVAVIITWFITRTIVSSRSKERLAEKERLLAVSQSQLEAEKRFSEEKDTQYRQTLEDMRQNEERFIKAAKNELALTSEEALKTQKEEIEKRTAEVMGNFTSGLEKDFKAMKESFDKQKEESIRQEQAIHSKFDETVKNLKEQTEAIGNQAEGLANALQSNNKMQGCFGETILENILTTEGFQNGRDYDSEVYLLDKNGKRLKNDETGKTMRPDFVLHFPDNTDILLDSKVSLKALTEYMSADNEEDKKKAMKANLDSVLNHINELVGKEYQRYVIGRKTIDYVIMFIPNYNAYQLAKMAEPSIFTEALRKNVLITTEETLIPFLKLIRSAWITKAQMDNMEGIVNGARMMLERVNLFSKNQAEIESKMEKTLEALKTNGKRLVEGNQSIAKAAQTVIDCGVKVSPDKALLPQDI